MPNPYLWILIMAAATYMMRVLPLTLMKKPIENAFIQSFLYYVPYVTLAVMTFPAIIESTQSPAAGALALLAGIVTAWVSRSLFITAGCCCLVVLAAEFFLL